MEKNKVESVQKSRTNAKGSKYLNVKNKNKNTEILQKQKKGGGWRAVSVCICGKGIGRMLSVTQNLEAIKDRMEKVTM